ncbi:small ribosomal subunit Rsm22 family protein [Treponema sp. OMZ 855]|uniref:small ribosomal subunit Rsm22 family protein n=1 Tax=Treponema sp. OMZ 855 TaxID=1643512 RepID=UPI0020A42A8D|nr:small ribosomal subunit Rsm22 family protein [Treponema sp. OMZ 855]
MQKPFYEKFIKKPSSVRTQDKRNQFQVEEKNRKHQSKEKDIYQKTSGQRLNQKNEKQSKNRNTALYTFGRPIFAELTPEAKNILEHFPALLDQVLPLDAKKKQLLPQHIHTLFHELTDERSSRKTHYLNDPVKLSAYTHYYVWWNLVRLTKLLQNLDIRLDDGDYAADFGSGPLTLVCALWIAKPELRKKWLTWYCVDISNKALGFGEELFLALCAYTGKKNDNGEIPWTVKKVCGAFGTPLSEKVSLVTEANMFNEIFWNSPLSLDDQAEKTHRTVMHYLKPACSVLFIEPGIPLAGEFLSLLRTEFLAAGFSIYAPCPHAGVCCFPNRPLQTGTAKMPVAFHKWCHFTFETHDSPENLLRLSEASHLGKERASLSFLYGTLSSSALSSGTVQRGASDGIPVRICSDIIKPDPQTIGRYACSEKGFMLITGHAYKESVLNIAVSGTLLILPEESVKLNQRDKKTHALLVEVP